MRPFLSSNMRMSRFLYAFLSANINWITFPPSSLTLTLPWYTIGELCIKPFEKKTKVVRTILMNIIMRCLKQQHWFGTMRLKKEWKENSVLVIAIITLQCVSIWIKNNIAPAACTIPRVKLAIIVEMGFIETQTGILSVSKIHVFRYEIIGG